MILKEGKNIPVASPQINDMDGALVKFRIFKNEISYQMTHFILFLETPGIEREQFFETYFSESITIFNDRYAIRKLTLL